MICIYIIVPKVRSLKSIKHFPLQLYTVFEPRVMKSSYSSKKKKKKT